MLRAVRPASMSVTRGYQLLRILSKSSKTAAMIFHSSRSGSTVLDRMLDQHPEVEWRGEVLNHSSHAIPFANKVLRGAGLKRLQMVPELVIRVHIWRAVKPIVGFETQYYQISLHGVSASEYVAALKDLGMTHFILLRRKNVLRQIASGAVARKRGRYSYDIGQTPPFVRVKLDARAVGDTHFRLPLADRINYHITCGLEIEKLLPECLRLFYEEDIEQDPCYGYRRICSYLGVTSCSPSIQTARTTPYPLREIIEDYDEVREHLTGTPHEWMLED